MSMKTTTNATTINHTQENDMSKTLNDAITIAETAAIFAERYQEAAVAAQEDAAEAAKKAMIASQEWADMDAIADEKVAIVAGLEANEV